MIDAATVVDVANAAKARETSTPRFISKGTDQFCSVVRKIKDVGNVVTTANPYAALGWGFAGMITNNPRFE